MFGMLSKNKQELVERLKAKLTVVKTEGAVNSDCGDMSPSPKHSSRVRKGTTYDYNGASYTAKSFAEAFGLSIDTVRRKLGKGGTPASILADLKRHKERITYYEFRGKSYSTYELIKLPECEVTRQTFLYRLECGWSIEAAITTKSWEHNTLDESVKTKRAKRYELNGRMVSLLQAARENNMGRDTLVKRVEVMGMSLADAIALNPTPSVKNRAKPKLYEYRGAKLKLSDLALRILTPGWFIEKCVDQQGMTIAQCKAEFKKRTPATYIYEGVECSLKELAVRSGISYHILRHRLVIREWPLEKALSASDLRYKESRVLESCLTTE